MKLSATQTHALKKFTKDLVMTYAHGSELKIFRSLEKRGFLWRVPGTYLFVISQEGYHKAVEMLVDHDK